MKASKQGGSGKCVCAKRENEASFAVRFFMKELRRVGNVRASHDG
jgi:hypothetical protein